MGSSKGSTTAKPKPGTVAAALQEKKESEKARSGSDHAAENKDSANHEDNNSDVGEGAEDDFRRGLTSEERVLLREKKKERLMKENESEHPLTRDLTCPSANRTGEQSIRPSWRLCSPNPSRTCHLPTTWELLTLLTWRP